MNQPQPGSVLKTKEEVKDKVHDAPIKLEQKIKVYYGRLGAEPKELTLTEGTTLGDVLKAEKADKMEVRVNRKNVPPGTVLKDGDVIVAVPDAIVGGPKTMLGRELAFETTFSEVTRFQFQAVLA